MERKFNQKRRESRELPPEKLFEIMKNLWGTEIALQKLKELGYTDIAELLKEGG